MKRTIYFTIGAPGSGKTTFANELIRSREDVATVHLDGIRSALFGSKRAFWDNPTDERRQIVRSVYSQLLRDLLKYTSMDIVLPNTNTDIRFYSEAVDRAEEFKCDMKIKIFNQITLPELLKRNAERCEEDRLKEHVVGEYFERMTDPNRYWRSFE